MEGRDSPTELSMELFDLYNSTDEQEHLDNAIAEGENELAAMLYDDPDRASALSNLSLMLKARYDCAENLDDLQKAVTNAREAVVAATAHSSPDRTFYLSHLGAMLRERHERTGSKDDIQQAVMLGQESVATITQDSPDRANLLSELGSSLVGRYDCTGILDDLQQAVVQLQEAVAITPHGDPDRAGHLSRLATALLTRYTCTGALDDLQQAISNGQDAIAATASDHPDRATYLNTLAIALKKIYEYTGAIEYLQKAITLGQEAREATTPGHRDRLAYSGNLVGALLASYECTGAMDCLERAITLGQEAVDAISLDDPERVWHLNSLANALSTKYECIGDVDDLQKAINLGQEAVELTALGHCDRPMYLYNLASALSVRYERMGAVEDLQQAIIIGREAVETTPLDHSDRSGYLDNLALSLSTRYECTGAMEDLQQAITLVKEALEVTPLGHLDRLQHLVNMASFLLSRHQRTGAIDDLEKAIALGREVLEAAPSDHINRPMYLNALAEALWDRYDRTGAMDDLQQAITLGLKAVDETPSGHPDRPLYLSGLARGLGVRYERTRAIEDLEQAIALGKEMVEEIPLDHSNRHAYLNSLAALLLLRYECTGAVDDLQQTIALSKEAVEAAPLNHLARAIYLDNLTTDLRTQYERTGDMKLLQQAIVHGQEAVEATPQDHYYRAERLNNLGNNIDLRYQKLQSADDLNECGRNYQEAWSCLTSPPTIRIKAARNAARILAQCSKWEESSLILEGAVQLLPKVSPRSLRREDQQFMLLALDGFAADAASLALKAGRSGYNAVKLLELSRGIIMGFAIDCRSDLSELKSTNPELFQKFDDLRAEIDSRSLTQYRLTREYKEKGERHTPMRRKAAIDEMEATLERIRQLPGHERFQLPPSEGDLTSLAKSGPIVVFNSSTYRSDAIIVTSSYIKALSLPKLDFTEASDRLRNMSNLTKATLRTYSLKNEEMNKLFLWLWDVAVEPVLQYLQLTPKPDAKVIDLSQIWWIGVGPLSRAPFHAAGDHSPKSIRNTLSFAVSSYTPTIKALSYVREKKFSLLNTPNTRLLLITMAETPGHPALPQAVEEVDEICKLTAGLISATHLKRPSAAQVLEQLASYNAVHFACHGIALNKNPSDSHLILLKDDGSDAIDKLTVGDISAANNEAAQLAYLSACSTASNPALSLSDEIIHIASGFQLAGFNHVLATTWKAHTITCKEVSTEFYASLFGSEIDCEDHRRVSMALHVAMKKARETRLHMPLRWAPFVHMGA